MTVIYTIVMIFILLI